MKVKIKKWHGVAIWKWEINEEVTIFLDGNGRNSFFRSAEFVECHLKLVALELNILVTIVLQFGEHVVMRFICNAS